MKNAGTHPINSIYMYVLLSLLIPLISYKSLNAEAVPMIHGLRMESMAYGLWMHALYCNNWTIDFGLIMYACIVL